ncbi:MAG TPA: ADP-ribosylation factor-directed GTPase activating protein isoform b [Pirellulales bacterium]|jgi:hypothetical protein
MSYGSKRFAQFGLLLFVIVAALPLLAGCSEGDISRASAATSRSKPEAIPAADEFRDRIDRAIALTAQRHLVAESNAAWQVVHGILAFGPDLQLEVDGKPTSALAYLQQGGRLTGWNLIPGDKGLEAPLEPASKTGQGHEDQWLGYLSLIGLPDTTPIKVGGKTYTVRDLVTQAQWDIYENMEATWSLMGFTAYLPLDAKWKSKDGSEWTIERVVAMESKQDLRRSACGGTHRLTALTVALNKYLESGGKLTGGWKAAYDKLYGEPGGAIAVMKAYQQPDGSFSSDYFNGARWTGDIGQRIGTTGHTLEFLALAVPESDLKAPWLTQSVNYLCKMLEETKEYELECGGLYHAARGLKIYRERRFGKPEHLLSGQASGPGPAPASL